MPIFDVFSPDITCNVCTTTIAGSFQSCGKIKKITPHPETKCLTVETESFDNENEQNIHLAKMQQEAKDNGYKCYIVEMPRTFGNPQEEKKLADFHQKRLLITQKNIRRDWIKGLIGLLSGTLVVLLCALGISMLGMYVTGAVSTLLTLYFGRETYRAAGIELGNIFKTIKKIFSAKKNPDAADTKAKKTLTLSMNSLFTVSTLAALGLSIAAFFVPGLPMMFDTALLILGFKSIGNAIKASAEQQFEERNFRDAAPTETLLKHDFQHLEKVPVEKLQPGQIIRIFGGQTVPVDGICLHQDTTIYNTIISGKTIPQHISLKHTIYAGCSVPKDIDYIEIEVARTAQKSYLAFLDQRIQDAKSASSKIERSAASYLNYFIPAVFAIALASGIAVSFFFSPILAIQSAIGVLVSACPCTLGLITSLAMKAGMNKAAAHGISWKNGESIEAAAQPISRVVFDLNSTLTTGIPKVTELKIHDEFLPIILQMEKESEHPIAKAIYQSIREKVSPQQNLPELKIDSTYHAGISAKSKLNTYCIGNKKLMEAHGINVTEVTDDNAEHVIYFAKNNQIQGHILLEDSLRDDALRTIAELQKQGKEVHICTGATLKTAQKYADKLGISHHHIKADCYGERKEDMEHSKAGYITELSHGNHRVAMVGDGGNDALAMSYSHYSVAIKSFAGNPATQATAHAIIQEDSLWSLVTSFAIAKQTMRNIKQNFAMSFAYNFMSMLAFSGPLLLLSCAINPAIGAGVMVLQTIFVLLNVLWLKHKNVPQLPNNEPPLEKPWQSTDRKLSQQLTSSGFRPERESQPSSRITAPSTTLNIKTAFVGADPCVRPAAFTITPRRTHGSTK